MPEITLKIDGLDRLERQLNKLAQGMGESAGNALRAEAEVEMTEAKRLTPVLTGALRGSGHVTGPDWRGRTITVTMGFGGPAAPYAVYVHQDEEAFHRNGQAKFLEEPLLQAAPHLPRRVAARMSMTRLGLE